jgi:MFS family permease
MSAAMIGGALGLIIIGKISRRVSPKVIMTFTSLASATTALAIAAMVHSNSGGLLIASGLFGAAAFCLYPLGSASVNAVVRAAMRVVANAWFILATGIGGTLGPLLPQALLEMVGKRAPFVVIAGATLGAGLFVLPQRIRSAAASHPAEEKSMSSGSRTRVYFNLPVERSPPASFLAPCSASHAANPPIR